MLTLYTNMEVDLAQFHYVGFGCTGDETHLANCSVEPPFIAQNVCGHFEDAGVRCVDSKSIKQLFTRQY